MGAPAVSAIVAKSVLGLAPASARMCASMRRFYPADERVPEEMGNHAAMVSLYFMYYNFSRVDRSLRVKAAMEAALWEPYARSSPHPRPGVPWQS